MTFWTNDLMGEMNRLRREMDRLLDQDGLSGWTFPYSKISFLPGRAARAYPLVNVNEDIDHFYIDALAPGVDPKTWDISVTGNKLSISGEKNPLSQKVKPESIHRSERSTGRFFRTVNLSADVDGNRVSADYSNGLLKIKLPKREEAKPKKISVSVS